MIHELNHTQLELARPLIKELDYQLVIESVIVGNTRGRIWVDDPNQPSAALIWNLMDALLLEGTPHQPSFNQALNRLIQQELIPDAQRRQVPYFSLAYASEWDLHLPAVLAGLPAQKAPRLYYTLDRLRVDWRSALSADLRMRRIDEKLLADERLENRRAVIGWIRSFWPSLEDFVARGIGYCLTDGHIITSWCLSVFVCDRRYELGLETALPYRGKNYATLTAAACVEHCLQHQLTPLWHCWENNRASSVVAEKVGFQKAKRYEVYHIQFQGN